jgi:beta-fructofuranosidase
MTRRGTREQSVVDLARSLFYERAMVMIDGNYVGAVAAISKASANEQPDLNYGEIFIRDNVPVMIYLLFQGKHDIVRHFLDTCLRLQRQQFETRGIFPTSFVERDGNLMARLWAARDRTGCFC